MLRYYQNYFMKFTQYHSALLQTPEDPDHLYRPASAKTIKMLEKIQELDFIVPFEITSIPHHRFKDGILLKIPKFDFDIRIQELPKAAARDLLVQYIDAVIQGLSLGYVPWDITESNMIYQHNRGYYTDLGGMRGAGSKGDLNYMFVKSAYLFERYIKGNDITFQRATFHNLPRLFTGWVSKQAGQDFRNPALWEQYKKILQGHKVPEYPRNHWADEYATTPTENKKLKKAIPLLEPTYGGTLLDVGTNKGYLCDFLADKYKSLCGFDYIEKCIAIGNLMYRNHDNVTLTVMDIQNFFDEDPKKRLPIDRYQADTLVALAVTHHFETAKISAHKVAKAFTQLARKWILLEEVGPKVVYINAFTKAGFRLMSRIPSYPENRQLSLWKREE